MRDPDENLRIKTFSVLVFKMNFSKRYVHIIPFFNLSNTTVVNYNWYIVFKFLLECMVTHPFLPIKLSAKILHCQELTN